MLMPYHIFKSNPIYHLSGRMEDELTDSQIIRITSHSIFALKSPEIFCRHVPRIAFAVSVLNILC